MCCGGRACPTGSETMSKTRLFNAVKSLDLEAVSVLLGSHPELAKVKDERRRNALHFLCGLPASDRTSARSLALARLLLDRGFDIDEPACVEGGSAFKATPLWYTLSRGRNLPLAKLLLKRRLVARVLSLDGGVSRRRGGHRPAREGRRPPRSRRGRRDALPR